MDTQFGSKKHFTRQLPSFGTISVLITWPGRTLSFIGSLKMMMRLYSITKTARNNECEKKSVSIYYIPPLCSFIHQHIKWRNSWFLHDVAKIQTKKLLILLSVYFHEVLQQLKNLYFYKFSARKGPNSFWDSGHLNSRSSFCVTRNLSGDQESSRVGWVLLSKH